MDFQPYFLKFNETIKLSFDDNQPLRDKRDILLNALRNELKGSGLTFSHFDQGSYKIKTGIEPLNGDYDIDVGLTFNIDKDKTDPIKLKNLIYNCLREQHNRKVQFKRPCIRVQYTKDGKSDFHVDLAIYGYDKQKNLYIAKGLQNSSLEYAEWEVSDPEELLEKIKSRFAGDDIEQFRRIVRYLKCWKECAFAQTDSNGTPTGIALTACVYNWLSIQKDWNGKNYAYNDFAALKNVVNEMVFNLTWATHIKVELPVIPYNNLFEKINKNRDYITGFQKLLMELAKALREAENHPNPAIAISKLRSIFGGRFPQSV